MKEKVFRSIVKRVPEFSNNQRLEMYNELEHSGDLKTICDLFEKARAKNLNCPRCSGREIVKYGMRTGLIRYRCKSCGRTFNALTGTPFARLRKKELWLSYLKELLSSTTLRKAAAHLGVDKNTTFRWRHRFLAKSHNDKPELLSGIIEADETYFRKSKKGCRNLKRPARKRGEKAPCRGISKFHVCVLVTCDRSHHEADYITGLGPVNSKWLDMFLSSHISNDSVLVTDSARAYNTFCNHQHIKHVSINIRKNMRTAGPYHIQHVNAYHSTLKRWIRRFNGIATKYLNHYLGWCHELFSRKITTALALLKALFELNTYLTHT